jgi:peptide/nickel transport system permease protein|tara:strand:- start:1732 stop:2583 length:852 start_codon:yes stop_codon:yes gene_type:complete
MIKNLFNVLKKDPYALTGALIYLFFIIIAIFADLIAPNDPLRILFNSSGLARNIDPGREFLLGTTSNGRDIFSQLVHGSRNALYVGLTAALAVAILGTIVGLISGYFGGWVDNLIMRLADIALGIPFLPFVIVLAAFLGPSSWNVVIAISILLWPNSGRVIRSQVLSLRERAYIESAKVSGCSNLRIIFVHIGPNILPLSFLYGSIAIGWAILTEASISFLGFGPSDVISWGYMLQDAYSSQALSLGAYFWFIPPGVCIVLMVVAGFFISRGYEEILFPRIKN